MNVPPRCAFCRAPVKHVVDPRKLCLDCAVAEPRSTINCDLRLIASLRWSSTMRHGLKAAIIVGAFCRVSAEPAPTVKGNAGDYPLDPLFQNYPAVGGTSL